MYARSCGAVETSTDEARNSSTTRRLRRTRSESRSEEHTSELQSRLHLVCRLLLEKKKSQNTRHAAPRPGLLRPPLSPSPRPTGPALPLGPDRGQPAHLAHSVFPDATGPHVTAVQH